MYVEEFTFLRHMDSLQDKIKQHTQQIARIESNLSELCKETYQHPSRHTGLPFRMMDHKAYEEKIKIHKARIVTFNASIASLNKSLASPENAHYNPPSLFKCKRQQEESALCETKKLLERESDAYFRLIKYVQPINATVFFHNKEALEDELMMEFEGLRATQIAVEDALNVSIA